MDKELLNQLFKPGDEMNNSAGQKDSASSNLCEYNIVREKIQEHMATSTSTRSPHTTVKCCFFPLGCHKKLQQEQVEEHMKSNIEKHLQLILYAFQDLQKKNIFVSEISDSGRPNIIPTAGRGDPTIASGTMNALSENAESTAPNEASKIFGQLPLANSTSASASVQPEFIDQLSRLRLKEQKLYQDDRLTPNRQALNKLHYNDKRLEEHLKALEQKVCTLEDQVKGMSEIEGRLCNGLYIWKIQNYFQHRTAAKSRQLSALYSPPFYTDFYGYKLCIRCNINGVSSTADRCLSLFIHFMQGEWDGTLKWPFQGNIVLSILDQTPDEDQRQDAVETLVSKPLLDAFQRPKTNRNPKGFGFTEYIPLDFLDNSTYISDNTLMIKVQVFLKEDSEEDY